MKKLSFILLLCVVPLTLASAFDSSKLGLRVRLPIGTGSSVGVVYEVNEKISVVPYLTIDSDNWDEKDTVLNTTDSYSDSIIVPGVEVNYVVLPGNPLTGYFGGFAEVRFDSYKIDYDGGGSGKNNYTSFTVGPQFGAEYKFTKQFAIYGSLRLGLTLYQRKNDFTGIDESGWSLVTSEPALGAIFHF